MFKPASDVPPPTELTPQEQEKWQKPMRVMDKIGLMNQIVQRRAEPTPPATQALSQPATIGAPALPPAPSQATSPTPAASPAQTKMVNPIYKGLPSSTQQWFRSGFFKPDNPALRYWLDAPPSIKPARSFNTVSQPTAQPLATRYQTPQPTMGAAPLIGGSAFRR